MCGQNRCKVLARQTCIFEQGVNFVPFDLEAFVPGGFFMQVTNKEVGKAGLKPLGIVDEQALLLLALEANLDGLGLSLATGAKHLVFAEPAAVPQDIVVIQARELGFESLRSQ